MNPRRKPPIGALLRRDALRLSCLPTAQPFKPQSVSATAMLFYFKYYQYCESDRRAPSRSGEQTVKTAQPFSIAPMLRPINGDFHYKLDESVQFANLSA
jgi:hypothetical protein